MLHPKMSHSLSLVELVKRFEGYRLDAYQDIKGVWTIGYGHTKNVYPGMRINSLEAISFLNDDYRDGETCANFYLTFRVTQDEFDAIVDFIFNLGCGKFVGSTLLSLINAGNIPDAARQFELWDYAGGKVVAGLLRRRIADEDLFDGKSTQSSTT